MYGFKRRIASVGHRSFRTSGGIPSAHRIHRIWIDEANSAIYIIESKLPCLNFSASSMHIFKQALLKFLEWRYSKCLFTLSIFPHIPPHAPASILFLEYFPMTLPLASQSLLDSFF